MKQDNWLIAKVA